jgi:quinol monooxygenase YgiN
MLIVTGRLAVAPPDLDAFETGLRAVAEAARKAAGCRLFAVAVEDASAGQMLVVELWRDRSAQQAFLQEPGFQDFARRWAGRMRNELRLFDAAPAERDT